VHGGRIAYSLLIIPSSRQAGPQAASPPVARDHRTAAIRIKPLNSIFVVHRRTIFSPFDVYPLLLPAPAPSWRPAKKKKIARPTTLQRPMRAAPARACPKEENTRSPWESEAVLCVCVFFGGGLPRITADYGNAYATFRPCCSPDRAGAVCDRHPAAPCASG